MPRLDLRALRKPVCRCNNSSPRYKRENHYAIFARLKISQVLKSQDKHNASYFPKCRASTWPAMAKLQIIFGVEKFIWNKTPKVIRELSFLH